MYFREAKIKVLAVGTEGQQLLVIIVPSLVSISSFISIESLKDSHERDWYIVRVHPKRLVALFLVQVGLFHRRLQSETF